MKTKIQLSTITLLVLFCSTTGFARSAGDTSARTFVCSQLPGQAPEFEIRVTDLAEKLVTIRAYQNNSLGVLEPVGSAIQAFQAINPAVDALQLDHVSVKDKSLLLSVLLASPHSSQAGWLKAYANVSRILTGKNGEMVPVLCRQ